MPYSQVDPQFEFYLRDNPGLSYADDSSPWLTRRVTRTFEKWLGRERLEAHYHALKNNHTSSQDFFRQALEISGVDLECDMSPLSKIPQNHPVIFIANHPFGVIDGLILCNIALRLNDNFRVVINSLLCQDRDLASHFLPIDFSGSKEASRRNIRAKQLANEALSAGIPLILFPSAWSRRPIVLALGRCTMRRGPPLLPNSLARRNRWWCRSFSMDATAVRFILRLTLPSRYEWPCYSGNRYKDLTHV